MRFSGREHSPQQAVVVGTTNSDAVGHFGGEGHGGTGVLARTGTGAYSSPSATPHSHAALRSALIAGVIAVLLSSLPLRAAFVFALPVAGFACVSFYRRRNPGVTLLAGNGFRLGALAGLFGFAMLILLGGTEMLVFHLEEKQREAVIEIVRQAQARASDPQTRQALDYFTTSQGMVVMMVLGLIFMGISFVVLSGLGGAVAAALLGRKDPPKF